MRQWTAVLAGWATCGALAGLASAQIERAQERPRVRQHEQQAERVPGPRRPAVDGSGRGMGLGGMRRGPHDRGPGFAPRGRDVERGDEPRPPAARPECDCPCHRHDTDRPAPSGPRGPMMQRHDESRPGASGEIAPPRSPAMRRGEGRAGPRQPAPSTDRPQRDRPVPRPDRPGADRRPRAPEKDGPPVDRLQRFGDRGFEPADGPPKRWFAPEAAEPDVDGPRPPGRPMRMPPQTL